MEEELILQQPSDRRLGNANSLPPGPPGAEYDSIDMETKVTGKLGEKESSRSRRRSPSPVSRRRRSPSPRNRRRSPSPIPRRRRSPSPRRNRFRNYSPDRRGRRGGRDRDRDRERERYRGRVRTMSRSHSRSISPKRGGGGINNNSNRWSPNKKPNSPPPNPIMQAIPPPSIGPQTSAQGQNQSQFGVMPPQVYDNYGAATAYHQYGVPPPQAGFPPPADAYVMQAPQSAPNFNASYPPPPPNWGVNDGYVQPWLQPTVADQSQMQQQLPSTAPTTQQQQPIRTPGVTSQCLNVLTDAASAPMDISMTHDAAVAQEAENQRDELKKQRAGYMKKTTLLKRELKMLKEQRKDLNSFEPPLSPTTKGFIDENEKLQSQITKKIATIENVIDMLTNIIGDENTEKDRKELNEFLTPMAPSNDENKSRTDFNTERNIRKASNATSTESSTGSSSSSSSQSDSSSTSENEEDDDTSSERLKNKVMESMKLKQKNKSEPVFIKQEKQESEKKRFNYVFYDPEMHWCQTCDVFPKTAKDYLNHLHTKEHMDRESIETPWHTETTADQYPNYENAPIKRTPIRGLTFFVPATAWFCKLCNEWMGDLHCASTHLKSQTHSNKYNSFLEKNPHFEVNWLADRDQQRLLNEQESMVQPSQITSVSTTAAETNNQVMKNSKKDDSKSSKKRKRKNSEKKDKKKKKKRSKKRKHTTSSGSSSSSESTSGIEKSKKPKSPIQIKELDNPNPASSIRVAMRKQEFTKEETQAPPPPPSINVNVDTNKVTTVQPTVVGKWTTPQDGGNKITTETKINTEIDNKREDTIIQQWNTVQPVISESEKKLLEQLKGKLKNKPREEPGVRNAAPVLEKSSRERQRRGTEERRRRSRSPIYRRGGGGGTSRSRTPSSSRSRSRGRGRRSRSRSLRRRGTRFSPFGGRGGRRRRSRSRSLRRRSRSRDRRRRSTRSRSHSSSRNRVEKPVIIHSEFRPRVPEKDKEKDKKSIESKDKRERSKKPKTTTALTTGKKLPFIGKMPVFKKQVPGQPENGEKRGEETNSTYAVENNGSTTAYLPQPSQRPIVPTAAQIQMAMMEDAYGNAPPFHPDAGMVVDYDDLMPDPVQFVNLMSQAPPPPPPTDLNERKSVDIDEADMLPPGIDETESEEFVPKPMSDAPMPHQGQLPKDLEEALNIIFPGEKKEDDDDDEADKKKKTSAGETQIITDQPVMQAEDLVKEGIHLITIDETSLVGMDEASQLSMNEPLVFNKPNLNKPNYAEVDDSAVESVSFQNATKMELVDMKTSPIIATSLYDDTTSDDIKIVTMETIHDPAVMPTTADIPIPGSTVAGTDATNVLYNLDDIPHPPPSPTESEKTRRQEELDDLAMLGIDADDMAAQCM